LGIPKESDTTAAGISRLARERGHLLGCRGHHALAFLDASSSEDARFRGHDGQVRA
jgi:hypothetical protein